MRETQFLYEHVTTTMYYCVTVATKSSLTGRTFSMWFKASIIYKVIYTFYMYLSTCIHSDLMFILYSLYATDLKSVSPSQ